MERFLEATAIAAAVGEGMAAVELLEATLASIEQHNPTLNCFTEMTAARARSQARALDDRTARGRSLGALAGVPFAVKNLFDIAGMTTLAGSKINRDNPPATTDATAVSRLEGAGAVLVGALNMDEYAYGFVTENAHYGTTANPHDLSRIAGGSSGGSAAAVAAGLVPLSLGSDTNGSVRVPAALCGIYGFKPTYGRLSRAGTVLFASSLDHVGIFARSVADVALGFDCLQGADDRDPVCLPTAGEATLPGLDRGVQGLRMAIAGDYFTHKATPEALLAVEQVAAALGVQQEVVLPEAERARSAAYIITAAEGAAVHLDNLRRRPQDFDPATRDRFFAGALVPAGWYLKAQRFRRWYALAVRRVLREVDIILAPTTPCVAPAIAEKTMHLDGEEVLVRPHLGRFTQPLSLIGLPVLSVPVAAAGTTLPLGVQLIAAPGREGDLLRVAATLEGMGTIAAFAIPSLPSSLEDG